jgi:hypothetical protein
MNKTLLPLLLVSAVALSGCGKKKEEQPAPTPPAQQPAAKPVGAVDQAKQVAADVAAQAQKAGEQVVEQGKQVVAQTTEQAKAAAAQVTESAKTAVAQVKDETKTLVDSFKKPAAPTGADAVATLDFAALTSKVSESAKSLLSDPAVTAPVKEQLTKLTDAVLGNKDGVAAAALNKIVALKPSEDQMGLVKELQSNLGVLALGRNFDVNDPASSGAVKQTIAAIQAKDTASIVSGLQKLGTTAKLTDAQKDIVGNLVGSYGGKLAGVTDSVNKASEALKGFGF